MNIYIFFVLCWFLLHYLFFKYDKRKDILICGAFYQPERLPLLSTAASEVKGSPKVDTNGGHDEKVWKELETLREQTKRKLHQITREVNRDSRLKAIHGYKLPSWQEIWDDCDDLIKEMADPAERDLESISELLEDLQKLDEALMPIADLFENQSEPKTTSSQRDEESTQKARTPKKSTPKKSTPKKRRVSTLRIYQQAPNDLKLADGESELPQEQIELYKQAQEMVLDLYRKDAKYGDRSSAFMVLIEQAAGGVGGEPQKIVANTLHKTKCQESIVGLRKRGQGLPQKIEDRIQIEISKMQEAIDWADNYRAGNAPKLPWWTKPYKSQIEKYMD